MSEPLIIHTRRLELKIVDIHAAAAVLDYYARNRAFHQPWFPMRQDQIFTISQQKANLATEQADFAAGRAVTFWLALQSDPKRIIGRFAFTNIIHGSFNSCYAAWHLDQNCQGSGLAKEAGDAALTVMFKDFALHRIEANILPRNQRSIALAERLGFQLEGLSSRYLKINDIWEDHLHYVRLADDPVILDDSLVLESGFMQLRPLQWSDAQAGIDYFFRNQEYLFAWNPEPCEDNGSPASFCHFLAAVKREQAAGARLAFGIFLVDQPSRLVGIVDCRAIRPLPFSSCEIGYSIDRLLSGRGLMADALSLVISYIFSRFELQRITASCCAGNIKSIKTLSLLGFHQEGLSCQAIYLKNSWQDLINMALLRKDFRLFNQQEQ